MHTSSLASGLLVALGDAPATTSDEPKKKEREREREKQKGSESLNGSGVLAEKNRCTKTTHSLLTPSPRFHQKHANLEGVLRSC